MKFLFLFLILIFSHQDIFSEWDPNLESNSALSKFQREKDLIIYFEKAYAYVIFPKIVKVGFVLGGAGGKGEIFQGDELIGCSRLSQAKVGLIWGGNSYSQIIFIQNKETLKKFMEGNFEFGGDVSGQFFTKGGGIVAAFKDGIAISTISIKGLGYDVSLAGQSFKSKEPNDEGNCIW
tara:strand:- start:169 stop:702 length:534 start_codon:yes stop_codon:yes gene_type:complete